MFYINISTECLFRSDLVFASFSFLARLWYLAAEFGRYFVDFWEKKENARPRREREAAANEAISLGILLSNECGLYRGPSSRRESKDAANEAERERERWNICSWLLIYLIETSSLHPFTHFPRAFGSALDENVVAAAPAM